MSAGETSGIKLDEKSRITLGVIADDFSAHSLLDDARRASGTAFII